MNFSLFLAARKKFRDSDRRVPTVVRTTCQSGRRKFVRLSKKARHFCHFFAKKVKKHRDCISRRNMPALIAICSASMTFLLIVLKISYFGLFRLIFYNLEFKFDSMILNGIIVCCIIQTKEK